MRCSAPSTNSPSEPRRGAGARAIAITALMALGASLTLSLDAQQRPAFRAGVDLVSLNVTVTGPDGRYVSDLSASDFAVLEDGRPQELSLFERAGTPLSISLLIDSSGSMRNELPLAQRAASDFVSRLRPGDLAQIVDFDRRLQVLQSFTDDQQALQRAIARLRASGSTSMYNAVYIALQQIEMLAAPPAGEVRRDVVVVLSDGEDTSSLVSFDAVLERARASHGVIYTIGLGLGGRRNVAGTDPEFALRRLAQETGGRLFLARNASSLGDVYGQIADELASQYVLGYVSNSTGPPGWRRVAVRVERPETQARTRSGYYAGRAVGSVRR